MLECIDLFCGAGGLSLGLRQAGFKLRVAVDQDRDCETTYSNNFPRTEFIRKDIAKLESEELLSHISDPANFVLAGGPPCQLFSRLNRSPLEKPEGVRSYMRIVRKVTPKYVVFENVPAIMNQRNAWDYLIKSLKRTGYDVVYSVMRATNFGVPQVRERVIVLASLAGKVSLPEGNLDPRTVRDAISHLPNKSAELRNHIGMKLSERNLNRIKKLEAGGKSRDNSASFSDSYARMRWDVPSPTITTKCISFSNGRFGHPEFHRALTILEAAILQGFPEDYVFSGNLWSCARQVGNAVPPPVAKALGDQITKHHRQTLGVSRKVA